PPLFSYCPYPVQPPPVRCFSARVRERKLGAERFHGPPSQLPNTETHCKAITRARRNTRTTHAPYLPKPSRLPSKVSPHPPAGHLRSGLGGAPRPWENTNHLHPGPSARDQDSCR